TMALELPPWLEARAIRYAGRGVFAVRQLPRGGLVLSAKPIMRTISRDAKPFRCCFCFSRSELALSEVCRCRSAWCSPTCRHLDEAHAAECVLLAQLASASAKVPSEVWENAALLASLRASLWADPSREAELEELMQEPPSRAGARRRQRCRAQALQLLGLEGLAGPGARALGAMPLNAFGLFAEDKQEGQCLAPVASLLNHSCIPNCVHRIEHGLVCLYALRDIQVDEEITPNS
ncbi:unnamed protein product, partial [Effrenium voratum]